MRLPGAGVKPMISAKVTTIRAIADIRALTPPGTDAHRDVAMTMKPPMRLAQQRPTKATATTSLTALKTSRRILSPHVVAAYSATPAWPSRGLKFMKPS